MTEYIFKNHFSVYYLGRYILQFYSFSHWLEHYNNLLTKVQSSYNFAPLSGSTSNLVYTAPVPSFIFSSILTFWVISTLLLHRNGEGNLGKHNKFNIVCYNLTTILTRNSKFTYVCLLLSFRTARDTFQSAYVNS